MFGQIQRQVQGQNGSIFGQQPLQQPAPVIPPMQAQ